MVFILKVKVIVVVLVVVVVVVIVVEVVVVVVVVVVVECKRTQLTGPVNYQDFRGMGPSTCLQGFL